MYVVNVKTKKRIKVNGPTYRKLQREGYAVHTWKRYSNRYPSKTTSRSPRTKRRTPRRRTHMSPKRLSNREIVKRANEIHKILCSPKRRKRRR